MEDFIVTANCTNIGPPIINHLKNPKWPLVYLKIYSLIEDTINRRNQLSPSIISPFQFSPVERVRKWNTS